MSNGKDIDKLDIDKLTSVPIDLVKLSNVVKNDVVKMTEYDQLVNKVNGIDTTNFVSRTKYEKDGSGFEDKINKIDKKIPDVSDLATTLSIMSLLPISTFNSKITETENEITSADKKIPSINNLATKTELTNVENKIPNADGFVKKSDYATEITSIKNGYATNTALDSKLNDLKSQHIADEIKKIDDTTEKDASDILGFESRLKQKEDFVDEGKRENSFARGFYYYLQQSYLVYGRMSVEFNGNYFVQNKVLHPNTNNVVNIYIVYKLDPISSSRNTDNTIQNALFGAIKITKMLIDQKINMKDMAFALMKVVHLLQEILLMIEMY